MFDNKNEFNNSENISSESNISSADNAVNEEKVNSYEWNSPDSAAKTSSANTAGNEYHYSYVNGNNKDADHNPNKYSEQYSSYRNTTENNQSTVNSSASQNYAQNNYGSNQNANPYGAQQNYGNQTYSSQNYTNVNPNSAQQHNPVNNVKPPKKVKPKKPKKPVSRGGIAVMLVITMLASAALGFGGGYLANRMNTTTSGNLTINKADSGSSGSNVTNTSATGNTSTIVQKTADSVVEISTESVVTGSFAQQYVQQGAGSGVIISEDGYILTNHHVIEGASTIKVTLRDETEYEAQIIGSDEDNDIALIKVEATGLTPATFGDSSKLAVGDYVVAIGNPLGTLGGTVTDGIISALAREVTIEDTDMTLLQTNAQVSPGNSGGGLFNANGELVGIVNAKDSATEVEGIAFAIPINNVLDILSDLKTYGYVTGKVELGLELTDITTDESAFYYGVNKTGCYILSVTSGSSAEKAGFTRGDLITKVNGTDVSVSSDVKEILQNCEVGDTVTFTIYRRGQTKDISFELEEYVPNISNFSDNYQSATQSVNESDNSIWSQMFDW